MVIPCCDYKWCTAANAPLIVRYGLTDVEWRRPDLCWEKIAGLRAVHHCAVCGNVIQTFIPMQHFSPEENYNLMFSPVQTMYRQYLNAHPIGRQKRKYAQTTLDTAVSLKKTK
jgi:hypothetical protein